MRAPENGTALTIFGLPAKVQAAGQSCVVKADTREGDDGTNEDQMGANHRLRGSRRYARDGLGDSRPRLRNAAGPAIRRNRRERSAGERAGGGARCDDCALARILWRHWLAGRALARLPRRFVVVVATLALFNAVALAGGFLHRTAGRPLDLPRLLAGFPVLIVILCLFAFAEEFGWRGFLLPKLLPLGEKRALLLSGVIWFCWEAPLVYFGLLDSTIVRDNPVLALVCHFIQTLCVAIALGYLRFRFGSVFLPAFAHGLLNSLGGFSFILFTQANPLWADLGGPIGTGLLLLLAAAVWTRLDRKPAREN